MLSILFFACGPATPETGTDETMAPEIDANETAAYCFRNEYPYQDGSDLKDIEEMELLINGNEVTGTFNWLPAEKDARRGKVEGTNNNGILSLRYLFTQEGQTASAELTATLMDDAIALRSAMPELGLPEKIDKVACR